MKYSKTHGLLCGSDRKHYPAGYNVWRNMRQRCLNKDNPLYKKYYGGRGIRICKRWNSFLSFIEDMGIPPKGFELDRINVNGNYCKSNCRWVDKKTQQRNQRRTVFITYRGIKKRRLEWAEYLGIKPDTIRSRIRRGFSLERALTNKDYKHGKRQ